MHERIDMQGRLTLLVSDGAGRVIQRQDRNNRIVRAGRTLVAELFGGVVAGTPPTAVTHMAIGTGSTAAADDQVALVSERARKAIAAVTYSNVDEGTAPNAVQRVRASLRTVFDFNEANGPAPLREAGIFTAAAGGVMYNRVVFDDVTKSNAFQLTLLWEITF
jgi:hypothetical protein